MPSLVLLLATVPPGEVLQHTPRAKTGDPPSEEMAPPLDAVVDVMEDIADVVTKGKIAAVVAIIWFP